MAIFFLFSNASYRVFILKFTISWRYLSYVHSRNKVIYHRLTQNFGKSKKPREANIWHKREKAMSKKTQKTGTLLVFSFVHNVTSKTRGAFLKFAN